MDWLICLLVVLFIIDKVWFHFWYKKKIKRAQPKTIGELEVKIKAVGVEDFTKRIKDLNKELKNYKQLQKEDD